MAARKKLRCKADGCRFTATGPTKLHAHYKQHPTHDPKFRNGSKALPTTRGKTPRSRRRHGLCDDCAVHVARWALGGGA